MTLAAEADLELAVRSGGHSLAGHGVSDGGIVVDLTEMTALDIDPKGRTAWAQAGLTTGEYTAAAQAHELATGFGDTGSVGIGGITLGGGIGFLSRKHGLTIDSLLGADIVTADGEARRIDAENHPDLFWAIRGGGGNFGVVTRFHYRLHEVGTVVGGVLILPATPDNILSFVAAAESAPEELTTIANVMKAPPMPFLPEDLIGRLVIFGMMVQRRVGRGRRACDRTVPGVGGTHRRHGPTDALPGDLHGGARGGGVPPTRRGADNVHRRTRRCRRRNDRP